MDAEWRSTGDTGMKYIAFAILGIVAVAFVMFGGRVDAGQARGLSQSSILAAAEPDRYSAPRVDFNLGDAETPSPVPQLYWVDAAAGKIQRTHPDDHTVVEDVVASGLVSPRSIAVDVASGKMYWTDAGAPKIQRANLDGSDVEDLVTSAVGLRDPAGIALDLMAGRMYWIDRAAGSIQGANLDGSSIASLAVGLNDPYQIALDVTADKMYWTEYRVPRIRLANLSGSNARGLLPVNLAHPARIVLDVAAGKMYWTERHDVTAGDDGQDKIRRADLNVHNAQDLVAAGPGSVSGLALDLPAGKMYWTDAANNRIRRANLDGSQAEDVVTSGLDDPGDIVLAVPSEQHPDHEILEAVYHATGGENWTRHDNWHTVAPIGKWHGVTTRADGSVARLSLVDNGLTGEIPAELGNLSRLTVLNLGNNQLTGEIPAELGNLSRLSWLYLGENQLTGAVPAALTDLSNLAVLNLSHNRLTGEIPAELGKITSLAVLGLEYNRLTGEIPAELGSLTHLVGLGLRENALTGEIPHELRNLDDLLALYLSGNQFSGCVPYGLWDISTHDLEQLGLRFCEDIDRPALVALYNATEGGRWTTNTNWLSNADLTDWAGVDTDETGRVTVLHLVGNWLLGPIPAELGSLSELTALRLGNNHLSGEIPPELSDLASLVELVLTQNQLTGEIPSELGGLSNLSILGLGGTNRLTGCIPPVLRAVPTNDLGTLGLANCDPPATPTPTG